LPHLLIAKHGSSVPEASTAASAHPYPAQVFEKTGNRASLDPFLCMVHQLLRARWASGPYWFGLVETKHILIDHPVVDAILGIIVKVRSIAATVEVTIFSIVNAFIFNSAAFFDVLIVKTLYSMPSFSASFTNFVIFFFSVNIGVCHVSVFVFDVFIYNVLTSL
jgi:hypothetical protein